MTRQYLCTNFATACGKARQGEILALAPGAPPVCPDCRSPLTAVPDCRPGTGIRTRRALDIAWRDVAATATILAVLAGGASWCLRPLLAATWNARAANGSAAAVLATSTPGSALTSAHAQRRDGMLAPEPVIAPRTDGSGATPVIRSAPDAAVAASSPSPGASLATPDAHGAGAALAPPGDARGIPAAATAPDSHGLPVDAVQQDHGLIEQQRALARGNAAAAEQSARAGAARAQVNLAVAHMKAGQWQRAQDDLRLGEQLNADEPLIYVNRAIIRLKLGDRRGARANLDTAFRRGFHDRGLLARDPDLSPLFTEPGDRRVVDPFQLWKTRQ